MIIIDISLQMAPQTAFAEHDQVIQALPANAANHALNIALCQSERGGESTA
jgi:hypothetical protein